MDGLIQFIPVRYVYGVCGVLLSIVTGLLLFLAKQAFKKFESLWETMRSIDSELTLQRTNCLTTLQEQGREQITLLREIAESVSYLKGKKDSD
jgi:hypothetical protein